MKEETTKKSSARGLWKKVATNLQTTVEKLEAQVSDLEQRFDLKASKLHQAEKDLALIAHRWQTDKTEFFSLGAVAGSLVTMLIALIVKWVAS